MGDTAYVLLYNEEYSTHSIRAVTLAKDLAEAWNTAAPITIDCDSWHTYIEVPIINGCFIKR